MAGSGDLASTAVESPPTRLMALDGSVGRISTGQDENATPHDMEIAPHADTLGTGAKEARAGRQSGPSAHSHSSKTSSPPIWLSCSTSSRASGGTLGYVAKPAAANAPAPADVQVHPARSCPLRGV